MNVRRVLFLAIALLFAAVSLPGRAEDGVSLPDKKDFHLYLLIGQSNMAGRGEVDPAKNTSHPRVVKLDKNNAWVPAVDPLHFDKPAIAGVGPGSSFGPAMADANPKALIGLIPSAVGGTPLSRWQKGGDLWQQAIERTKIALRHGTLKGVIWHQGESDSKSDASMTYGARLAQMIVDLRAEFGMPDLPVVVGQLGVHENSSDDYRRVNQALTDLPKAVPHCACAESTGLTFKKDNVHFDADSARVFGRRYAKLMLALQQ